MKNLHIMYFQNSRSLRDVKFTIRSSPGKESAPVKAVCRKSGLSQFGLAVGGLARRHCSRANALYRALLQLLLHNIRHKTTSDNTTLNSPNSTVSVYFVCVLCCVNLLIRIYRVCLALPDSSFFYANVSTV